MGAGAVPQVANAVVRDQLAVGQTLHPNRGCEPPARGGQRSAGGTGDEREAGRCSVGTRGCLAQIWARSVRRSRSKAPGDAAAPARGNSCGWRERRGGERRDPGERAAGTYCKEWDKYLCYQRNQLCKTSVALHIIARALNTCRNRTSPALCTSGGCVLKVLEKEAGLELEMASARSSAGAQLRGGAHRLHPVPSTTMARRQNSWRGGGGEGDGDRLNSQKHSPREAALLSGACELCSPQVPSCVRGEKGSVPPDGLTAILGTAPIEQVGKTLPGAPSIPGLAAWRPTTASSSRGTTGS